MGGIIAEPRILVLGGCGFIGSHVVEALVTAGHSVRVADLRAGSGQHDLPGVEYMAGSLADPDFMAAALYGVVAVFHMAGSSFPATAEADPVADVQSNLVGTLHLLQSMERAGIRRLVYLSSGGTVYGVPETIPVPETHPLRPIGSYGIVKVAVEGYLSRAARSGLLPMVVRAANPYGPRQAANGTQGFIPVALNALLQGEAVNIWGDGSVVRDYLHVRDLARLCLHGLEIYAPVTVNAGSGRGISLLEILRVMERVTGRTAQVRHLPARPVDVPVSVLDVTLARNTFGWLAETRLEDGLAETWGWLSALA